MSDSFKEMVRRQDEYNLAATTKRELGWVLSGKALLRLEELFQLFLEQSRPHCPYAPGAPLYDPSNPQMRNVFVARNGDLDDWVVAPAFSRVLRWISRKLHARGPLTAAERQLGMQIDAELRKRAAAKIAASNPAS